MPKVSTNGPKNSVRPLTFPLNGGNRQAFSDDDTYLTVTAEVPASALVILPGPSSSPDNLPSSGDYYCIADPLGFLTSRELGVWGGGYPIQGTSHNTAVADLELNTNFQEACFTFDDTNQAWIVCICPGVSD